MTRAAILYSRLGCHLCEEMLRELTALQLHPPLQLSVEDVDRRAEWRAAYGLDVPVLAAADGEVICKHVLDETALRGWLGRQG